MGIRGLFPRRCRRLFKAALKCRTLAERITLSRDKRNLEEMAEAWEKMAALWLSAARRLGLELGVLNASRSVTSMPFLQISTVGAAGLVIGAGSAFLLNVESN